MEPEIENRKSPVNSISFQNPERLLTAGQVSRWLSVSSTWVRVHATRKEPRLKAVKMGKLIRFRVADVQQFIEQMSR